MPQRHAAQHPSGPRLLAQAETLPPAAGIRALSSAVTRMLAATSSRCPHRRPLNGAKRSKSGPAHLQSGRRWRFSCVWAGSESGSSSLLSVWWLCRSRTMARAAARMPAWAVCVESFPASCMVGACAPLLRSGGSWLPQPLLGLSAGSASLRAAVTAPVGFRV